MPIVIREKPEHVPLLNGIKFYPADGFSFSEEVSGEVADNFAQVEGYRIAADDELPEPPKPEKHPVAPKVNKTKQAKPEPVPAAEPAKTEPVNDSDEAF